MEPKPVEDAIEDVEAFLARIGPAVRYGGDPACYSPALDVIQLPEPGQFEPAAHFYATSLHEHTHWTSHPSRLDRDLTGRFGSDSYAAEELVAELAAAFSCVSLAILGRLRHSDYLASWLKILKEDKRAIFTAASKATQAAGYPEERAGIAAPETAE